MKIAPRLAWLLLPLIAACAKPSPYKTGDTLVSVQDGTVLGKVIAVGTHSFENGTTGPSIHVALLSGRDAWYTVDTTVGNYVVKK